MKGMAKIAKPRREVLPAGALVLERLLKHLQPREVMFSVFGIREGLLYGQLSEAERRKDPLLSFCADYARLRSRSAEHAAELCRWTDALFQPPGPAETEDERRLRWAACLLSDISWRAHPDYRAEQSLILIAQSALAAIDHPGRVFLAFASYFRHLGRRPRGRERCDGPAGAAPQGDRAQEALPACPDHRCGGAGRAHALDRQAGHHRQDAARLRARQARPAPCRRRWPPSTASACGGAWPPSASCWSATWTYAPRESVAPAALGV